MEGSTGFHDNSDSDSGPSTYVRGYHRLPQADPDIPPASDSDRRIPQEPYPAVTRSSNAPAPPQPPVGAQYDPAPPYTPEQQSSPYTPALQSSSYTPVPQSFNIQQQQQGSSNVVLVTQPSGSPSNLMIEEQMERRPSDHLGFTICTIIVCLLLGNWFALICLIPAAIFSLSANNASFNRNYVSAKRSANISLGCSICVYIQFLVVFIIAAIILAVLFTVGLTLIGIEAPKL